MSSASVAASGINYGQLATTALSAAGTGMAAGGQLAAGSQAAALGRAQAASLGVQAGQVQAEGSQQASNQALNTKFIISNVRGAAAASGGVATAPSVVDVEGELAARGSYSMLSDLYAANEKAAGMTYQGALDVYSGNTTQRADQVKALSTVLSGAGSLASKYGNPGGFNSGPLAAAQNPEFGGAMPAGGLT
jgi:hypothetical protein